MIFKNSGYHETRWFKKMPSSPLKRGKDEVKQKNLCCVSYVTSISYDTGGQRGFIPAYNLRNINELRVS